ncbi:hypothetical protein [Bradyrhizobium canariense]|uniref:hypothetical protein n=1 Tax=Bradyrhizobium canariense TaxID=255045 RepID=UPI0011BA4AC5|nr:hypothetical protein [Bradyrhizobium canariense]
MATISATAPSIGNVLAQLIASGSSAPPAPTATSSSSASSSAATSSAGSGAAVFVTLSDQAKAAAAAKVQSDQDAADRLQAYVDQQRANNAGTKTGAPVSLQGILEENTEATDTPPASAQPTTGSKVEAIVAQIKTLADANEPPPFQSFVPSKSLSNSLTVDGFTLTVDTNASTQFYGTALSGNGTLGGVDSKDSLLGANQIQGFFLGGGLGCDGSVGFERCGLGADGASDYRSA